jgi:hypothetical protein
MEKDLPGDIRDVLERQSQALLDAHQRVRALDIGSKPKPSNRVADRLLSCRSWTALPLLKTRIESLPNVKSGTEESRPRRDVFPKANPYE